MNLTVFIVVMIPSSSEKIIYNMINSGYTVAPIGTETQGLDVVVTAKNSFSSIVQFEVENDVETHVLYNDIREILVKNEIKFYALFVFHRDARFPGTWCTGNLFTDVPSPPDNVIPIDSRKSSN